MYGVNTTLRHSEMDVIVNFIHNKKIKKEGKYEIMNLRLSKTGKLNMSYPCIHCTRWINQYNYIFKNLYFSTENGDFKCYVLNDLNKSYKLYSTKVSSRFYSLTNR